MTRPVVLYPDPRLQKKSRPVAGFDESLRALAADMEETMREAEGVGLAAVQVGELVRMMTMESRYDQEDKGDALVLVNPEILSSDGIDAGEEGCLSLPEVREVVERAARVKVRSQDLEGREQVHEFDGLLARCVQHEVDHMNGHLFIEKVPFVKRLTLKPRLRELEKRFGSKKRS